jgi:hypothetical protein
MAFRFVGHFVGHEPAGLTRYFRQKFFPFGFMGARLGPKKTELFGRRKNRARMAVF